MNSQLMRGAPPGAIVSCHPSGWFQNHLFTEWFRHILGQVKPTAESPAFLILDRHYNHSRNLDVIHLAQENHVCILYLLPHATHKMQLLDKTFMNLLKAYYSEEVCLWMRTNAWPVTNMDIAELFEKANRLSEVPNRCDCSKWFPCYRWFSHSTLISAYNMSHIVNTSKWN